MNIEPLVCVIDANIALKVFFNQPLSGLADMLLAHMSYTPRAQFYVPDFFYAECATAFANYVRGSNHSARKAKADLAQVHALSFNIVPTKELSSPALEIAITHRIAGYDACYVALSQRVKAPLVTADEKLVRAMANTSYDVQSLVTFDIPPIV